MFASFAGTLLTIILIMIVFAGMMASLAKMTEKEGVSIKPHTVLQIKWKTPILDRSSQNPFEAFDFSTMKAKKPVGLNDILKNLDKASKDPNVAGIFLDMETIPAGIATTEEIRNKLLDFKKSGKFIVSYANNYDQKAYYLATVADKIYLNPEGLVLFKGLNAQVMFMKNLLEKLDVKMQIIRGPNNKFKSAVEPLMYDKMSAANREQTKVLLNSIWGKILKSLSETRKIPVSKLNQLADQLALSNAKQALEYHFVDGLLYRDQMIDSLKKDAGIKADAKLASVSFGKYLNVKSNVKKESKKINRNSVAVIYALGEISQGKAKDNAIGSATLAEAIRQARTNKHVKAIVMRVNSPGGDAQASEIIRREVELAKKAKPFVVSMGDVAASGGYWISTEGQKIFAQPTTITGSIGVFGIIPNFKGLMNKKLGITFDKVMTNKNADFIDVMSPMNDLQKAKLNASISRIYDNFTSLVARTRHLRKTYVDSIARGRVWSGQDALKLGLVDTIGGLQSAIAFAAKKADVGKNYRITEYPKRKEFFQQLMEELSGQAQARILSRELGDYKTYFDDLKTLKAMKGVQARMPFFMQIQ